jgi:hypothetical protein
MKKVMNESQIKMVVESIVKKLKEAIDVDGDNYFGGGLPDSYFKGDEAPETSEIPQEKLKQLENIAGIIADIANNTDEDAELLYQAVDCIDKFLASH